MPTTRMIIVAAVLVGSTGLAQTPADPFPAPIPAAEGAIPVKFVEFASIPDDAGRAARPMLLVDEPGTRRLFVNEMRGPLYTVSYDGRAVTKYMDVNASNWGVKVQSLGRERGVQSFAIHPQFNQPGTPGFGKLYTWTDSSNTTTPRPDFSSGRGQNTHATVLFEWTARNPAAATYDGGPPLELLRVQQPFANHNGSHISFNPLVSPSDADFGMLYVGVGDGGSGGDPLTLAQNLGSPFGKILRLNPLGSNSANGKYGVPAGNPFANDGNPDTLGEIYVYGVRNPQRFGWDSRNGNLFVADIGQDIVEELSLATAGAKPRLEQVGGELRVRQPPRGESRQPARRPESDLSGRRIRADRSAAPSAIRHHGGPCVPPRADRATRGPGPVWRYGQRRDLLYPRRQTAERRTSRNPPDSAERRQRIEDVAEADSGEKRQTG